MEAVLQAVCDGIEDALGFDKVLIELADEPDQPLAPVAATRLGAGRAGARPRRHARRRSTPLFTRGVRGRRLLPAARRGGRGRGSAIDDVPYRSELNGRGPHAWSRHWLLVPLVGGRAPDRADLGRRPARPPAAHPRAAAGAAAVRQPGRGRAAGRRPGGAAAPRGHARHAHRPAQPARVPPPAGARDRQRRGLRAWCCATWTTSRRVNDTHGHEAGDRALQMLADALRSQLRRSDEAYRIGGDEFAVVLPGADRLDAERVMRRLRDAVAAGVPERGDPIDASFGVGRLRARRRPRAPGGPRRRGALPGQAPARGERGLSGYARSL